MRDEHLIWLSLTSEEVLELFSRCLESQREDTEHSASALRKLAEALELLEPARKAS